MATRKVLAAAPRTQFGSAPPGYVPGLGRGAIGFTTRSDIGPARSAAGADPARPAPPKEGDYSESQFDEFSGYSENLFAGGSYDRDDEEADEVYAAIDQRMDSKRKIRRDERLKVELAKYRKKRPRIQEQFSDLKRELKGMGTDEWADIPESLDYSRRNKRMRQQRRFDRFTPVPDDIINSGRVDNVHGNMVNGYSTPMQSGLRTPLGGMRTPMGGARTPLGGMRTPMGGMRTPLHGARTPLGFMTPLHGAKTPLGVVTPMNGPTDLTQLGRARDKVLSLKLDRLADSVSGQTVVDPRGFLTDLNSVKVSSEAEVSDIKKARLLLKSVITTNPKHAPGWIAAARLEKETGKLAAARAVIAKGCEMCSQNEDVWLENAVMQTPRNAKSVLAKAVRHIPGAVKIWIASAALESDVKMKKAILRRALEMVPNSVVLWKAAVQLENPEDARIMLSRAVEMVPQSVEMWLALARLETYKKAQQVLNRARHVIPTEPQIWITAAKLEEANGNINRVDAIIVKAVKSLAAHQVVIDREAWLTEAENSEKSGSILTCQAIVKATIGIGVDEQDRKPTWLSDADTYLNKRSIETARAIFAYMITVFPGKKSVWLRAAQLERQYGTRETLDKLLTQAVKYCPQAETLWLMSAKERWLADDVEGARVILNNAFKANPDSEQVWLAAVKLESENGEDERAQHLLAKARERAGTARVWMKSAKLERALGNKEKEVTLLFEAIQQYPTEWKLWAMMAENLSSRKEMVKAIDTYKKGVKSCPTAVELWLCYAKFEVAKSSSISKARSILETARLKNTGTDLLWLAAIRLEEKAGKDKVAQQLLAKALQECPSSGLLWAHAIAADPRPLRKARSYDALKRCSDDPNVFTAVAKLFWIDRKVRKARNWFNRAVTVDPDLGNTWAWFYKFELEHGGPDKQKSVIKRCTEADPHHGELWCKVSKRVTTKETHKTDEVLKEVAASLPADIFDKKVA